MTNPKRYDPVIYGDEAVVDDGPYVKWEDYELLRKALDAVTKDRDDLQEKYNELVLSR